MPPPPVDHAAELAKLGEKQRKAELKQAKRDMDAYFAKNKGPK